MPFVSNTIYHILHTHVQHGRLSTRNTLGYKKGIKMHSPVSLKITEQGVFFKSLSHMDPNTHAQIHLTSSYSDQYNRSCCQWTTELELMSYL